MTITQARKILGKSSGSYSDDDILFLINQFQGIAEVVIDIVDSKMTTTGLDYQGEKSNYGTT